MERSDRNIGVAFGTKVHEQIKRLFENPLLPNDMVSESDRRIAMRFAVDVKDLEGRMKLFNDIVKEGASKYVMGVDPIDNYPDTSKGGVFKVKLNKDFFNGECELLKDPK